MNNLYKNILAILGSVLLVVLVIFMLASIDQKLNTATTTNTVTFQGEGRIVAKPDIAIVNFSIVTEAATSKAAQDANSPISKAITDFLKKQGVEDKDVKTTGYNIYPQYDYPRFDQPRIKSYQVSQSFEVKIRDLDKASAVIDGLINAGANNISQLNFTVDDPQKLQEEARAKAIADAKTKASTLEKQIGIRLGKIINFQENSGGYGIIPIYSKAELDGRGGGIEGPSLPVGENEIVINITLTYQIR